MPDNPKDRNTWARIMRLVRERRRSDQTFLALLESLMRRDMPTALDKPPVGIGTLTPTEKELIQRIVRSDNKLSVIWEEMGMKKRTFDTHMASIYGKFGVRKRSSLVREAMRWGVG